jgi:hypothetical protein
MRAPGLPRRTIYQRVEKPANKAHQEERSDLYLLRNERVNIIEQ